MLKLIFRNKKTTTAGILALLTLLAKFIPNLNNLPLEDIAVTIASIGLIFAGDSKSDDTI